MLKASLAQLVESRTCGIISRQEVEIKMLKASLAQLIESRTCGIISRREIEKKNVKSLLSSAGRAPHLRDNQ
jgi:hypothetical protein